MLAYQPAEASFSNTGRTPEDHGGNILFLEKNLKELALAEQVPLADELLESLRSHAIGQRFLKVFCHNVCLEKLHAIDTISACGTVFQAWEGDPFYPMTMGHCLKHGRKTNLGGTMSGNRSRAKGRKPYRLAENMKFVIVGNGIAGVSAAHAIRKIRGDASIAVVSDEAEPAYSACVLADYLGEEIPRDKVFIKGFSDYSQDRIQLLSSQKVTGVNTEDKKVILEKGDLVYDKLIIATGSKPLIPTSVPAEKSGVFTFKSLSDADKLVRWKGRSAVIVGSGPIGLEAGMALKRRGYRVVVIELLSHILPKVFDAQPAGLIKQILERNGVEVLEGERFVEILGTDSVSAVVTDKRTQSCDTVILAMGMVPRGGWAFDKVKRGEYGGIAVNERMETTLEDVFACGDCVDAKDLITGCPVSSMLWHNARRQGEVAGSNAAGVPLEYSGSLNVTGLNLFGVQAVSIGISSSEETDGFAVIEREGQGAYQRLILQGSEVVGVQSVNWPEDMGHLLTSIVRKEKVTGLHDALTKRRPPLRTMRPFAHVQR